TWHGAGRRRGAGSPAHDASVVIAVAITSGSGARAHFLEHMAEAAVAGNDHGGTTLRRPRPSARAFIPCTPMSPCRWSDDTAVPSEGPACARRIEEKKASEKGRGYVDFRARVAAMSSRRHRW